MQVAPLNLKKHRKTSFSGVSEQTGATIFFSAFGRKCLLRNKGIVFTTDRLQFRFKGSIEPAVKDNPKGQSDELSL